MHDHVLLRERVLNPATFDRSGVCANPIPGKSLRANSILVKAMLVSALAIVATVVGAQDVTPSADASVRGGAYANQNAGRSPSLAVKNSRHAVFDRWSYLKFDIDTDPNMIGKAMLVLSVRTLDGANTVMVQATSDRWEEASISGKRRPAFGKSLGTFAVSQVGEVVVDVTDYVRAEAQGDRQVSFALSAPLANGRYVSFQSRESGRSPLLLIDAPANALTTPPSQRVRSVASTTASMTAVNAATAIGPSAINDGPWTRCANEFELCVLPGPPNQARRVRYGSTSGRYVYRTYFSASISGQMYCFPRDFMGIDPAPGETKTCEYGPVLYAQLPTPTNPMGPAVDLTAIPIGDPGTIQALTQPQESAPTPQTTSGEFRTICQFSHMNFDDPIVYPGQPGRSHLHTYFGNTLANGNTTANSLATTGNSTCFGGILNRSAYWVPAVIDTRNGKPVAPTSILIYYKSSRVPASFIQSMPAGLRMVAGDMTASSAQTSLLADWECENGSNSIVSGSIPTGCGVGGDLKMVIGFPQCWDGVNLDSPNHKSHMAYAGANTPSSCPTSHPVPIPEITYIVRYRVIDSVALAHWRLSSDMYGTSIPGGFSIHGDWFNGWDETTKNTWVTNCAHNAQDCHGNLLGNGRELGYDPLKQQVEPILLRGSNARPARP